MLLCIDGEPTNEQIHSIMMKLYANAAAVPTTLGGSAHDHIDVVMDMTLYSTLPTTVYVALTQPPRDTLPPRAMVVGRETM
eukprot:11701993-Ditylum_brightwellii.AAC.1